jgi:hypothetical protein
MDTGLIEDLLPPIATEADRQSMFIERSRGVMEMRWTTRRRDGSSHSEGNGSDNNGRDNDEDEDKDGDEDDEDVDMDDEDDEDVEDEDVDVDQDELPFYDSEIPGISTWDLLGEDFEREAAALGLYSSRMNYLPS